MSLTVRQDVSSSIVPKSVPNAISKAPGRCSGLKAPIMHLSGHAGEVMSAKFSPDGESIASASSDHQIFLWNTYRDCENYGVLTGHTGAVLEVQWSRDGSSIISSSADKTVGVWDTVTGERICRLKGHSAIINSCSVSRRGSDLILSVGDDGQLVLWDPREKLLVESWQESYPLTAVAWGHDGSTFFTAGIENDIKVWDLRKKSVSYLLSGHENVITGLRTSNDGGFLLSNSMDNTLKIWDIKPFCAVPNRMIKNLEGAPHGFEKNLIRPCWSADGKYVASGSGDRSMVVWDVKTSRMVYKLPGHKGCVNEVDWHPKESIVLSASTDKTLFIGELQFK